MHLTARNHNYLALKLYKLLGEEGISQDSRNGPVTRICEPVTLTVTHPRERVNVWPERDANPFFHLMEALAMLDGFNDAPFLAHFASNMINYSDDGHRFNAFYGERLRRTWGDQLDKVISELRRDPESRQAVAQIWDPSDLGLQCTKDKACNLCLVFDRTMDVRGYLTMTSFNRSNDAIWGIGTGANVVHLSYFQEYVACALGLPLAPWHHFSANMHVYTENPKWNPMWRLAHGQPYDLYTGSVFSDVLLFDEPGKRELFDQHLSIFIAGASACVDEKTLLAYPLKMWERLKVECPFIATVAVPVFNAWQSRKLGHDQAKVQDTINDIVASDWRYACQQWVMRRNALSSYAKTS